MKGISTLLAALALLLAAAAAHAQVAAPDLNPATYHSTLFGGFIKTSTTITPDNPAALQWEDASLVAVGTVKQSGEQPVGTPLSASGKFGGFRGVWQRMAVGVEKADVDGGAGFGTSTTSGGQLSFRLLEGLAVGVGTDKSQVTNGGAVSELKSTQVGLSAMLGKSWYLGAAFGKEKYQDNVPTSSDRSTTLFGIAWRPVGAWRWHLAYDRIDKPELSAPSGYGFTSDQFTVQALAGTWLLGLSHAAVTPGVGAGTLASDAVELGWVPQKGGVSLTARYSKDEVTVAGLSFATVKTTSLALSYLF
jgi:hypothetical protein